MEIIIKDSYYHINRSFGNWDTPNGRKINGKDHYKRLMDEGNYTPYEESLDNSKKDNMKPYNLSEKGWAIIKAAKNSKDKKGNVKLSDRTIDAMKSIGVGMQKVPSYMQLPSAYTGKGGFST